MEKEQIILDCKNLHPKRAYPISYVADIYVETLSLHLFAFRRIVFQVNSTTQFTIPNTIYKNYRDMERFVIENYLWLNLFWVTNNEKKGLQLCGSFFLMYNG